MAKRYNNEFKRKIVDLANNGKKVSDIIDEYGIAKSTVHKWKKDFNNSCSFKAKDNRTDKEKELLKLRKDFSSVSSGCSKFAIYSLYSFKPSLHFSSGKVYNLSKLFVLLIQIF